MRQIITWDRTSGFNRQATYYTPAYEWLLLLAQPGFRLTTRNPGLDVWRMQYETGSPHPCPFPVGLPARAIETTGAKTVLDPFMGSGTTLVAAKDQGRKAVGIEKSERYCEIAATRLAQEVLAFD